MRIVDEDGNDVAEADATAGSLSPTEERAERERAAREAAERERALESMLASWPALAAAEAEEAV